MNVRSRYKTREPVEVVQQLESCHHESVTNFPLIEKTVFPEKYSDFRSKKGKNHPLKKAKSHLDIPRQVAPLQSLTPLLQALGV
jgi:hypothetical protein